LVRDRYSIARAELRHLDGLNDIELAAAQLLSGHAPPSVLEETTPHDVLTAAMRRGHLWVALAGDAPVGFAQVEMLGSDGPHLDEIDVHPTHARRGLGTRLIGGVCEWAAAAGYEQLTLTTFRLVPWNMPWYARLGFVELPSDQWGNELREKVDSETARGLDPSRRVVMAYWCARR
jgi:GNAT superfamily N-acetyltransferase